MSGFRSRFALIFGLLALATGTVVGVASGEDWPMYLHDAARSSTSGETAISPQNATNLTKLWSFKTGGGVAASPTVVGGVVYVGSWDGYEYALDATTGALKWKTNLGVTNGLSSCAFPQSAGITSSAAVVNGVVYVGGGDNNWYALNASTGAVLWKIDVGNPNSNTYDGHYNWASPLIYNGYAYIGIASLGDCPLVQGKLLKVDLSTHQIVATFNAVSSGQVGGGIWTSPTLDTATNTIYVTTGTQTSASQTYAQAMVSLDATALTVNGSWQVPLAQQVTDGDWGNTPTLLSGGLVAATNKNGVVYAFQRSNIPAGPVWQHKIANGGPCPTCGDGSVSSDAFDATRVYAGGAQTTASGTTYPGSITAFNPATGNVLWSQLQNGYVIPALTAVNGLVLAGIGSDFIVLSAATGQRLFSFPTGNSIFSPAAVSGGNIYFGSQDGYVYALTVGSAPPPPPPNTVRVDAGGGAYVDSQGNSWSADCCNSGGKVFTTGASVAGTNDPTLYQSLRWNTGPFSYTFSGLAAGSYQVALKFAETAGLGPGQRQFNVSIQGTQVLTNLDVAAQAGLNTALDKTFTATVDSNGQLTINFNLGAANYPIINAIQVVPATPPPPPNTVRVDAGGGAYVDSHGNSWSADCCNSGGKVFTTGASVAGTNDPTLYQSLRWNTGPFSYTFSGLAAGSYQVALKFAETAGLGPGQRQFNVSIQGTQVLTNLDVAAQAGLNTALDKTFTATVDSNGQLTINFNLGAANYPIINAIQILPVSSGSLSFASGPQTLTAGQPSAATQVADSPAQQTNVSVALSSGSSTGRFSTSASGPWSSTLTVTIPAGQTTSGSFYYQDTTAGGPVLTASAAGLASATQTETVTSAGLAKITVSPTTATVGAGGMQSFTAAGQDAYGNPVTVANASWSTTASGSVSPSTGSSTTFSAGTSAGSGSVTATVGQIQGSASVTVTVGVTTVRVDAGGGAYVDSQGNSWSADCCNSGGKVFTTGASVAGTNDPTLYQSLRWNTGPFSYTFSGLAAGSYQVALKFAETAGLGPGQRQFNVSIQGTQVLTNLDVAAQAGLNTALDKTFTATVDSNGQLTINFNLGAANYPIINAIQVVPATPPPPPNTVRVDAGGGAYVDSHGNSWSADCCNSGGKVFTTGASVAGTNDPTLYQSLRWNTGPFSYTFSGLAAGSYQVALKFAETAGLGPGQRQFNVSIQGTQVLTNLDVAAQAGLNTALDKTFTATVDSNGQLTINFNLGAANYPIINAIQIVPG